MQPRLDPDVSTLTASKLPPEQANALAQLADAVLHGGVHLMISAQNASLAQHAGAALDAWWRALAPHVEVTHFSSQAPLAWIGHINHMVSRQGLAKAMQTPITQNSPQEVAVIHEAEQLQASDLDLLQNLVAQMPGLPVRWVLLCHAPPADLSQTKRQYAPENTPPVPWVNWHINEPTPQAPPPTEAKLGKGPVREGLAHSIGALTVRQNSHGLVMGLSAVLLVAFLWTAMHLERPTQQTNVPPHLPESQSKADAPHADETAPATAALTPVKVGSLDASVPEEIAFQQVQLNVPDVALRGAQWLAKVSPEHFVLEHGRFQNAPQAQSLIRARAELKNARVIMLRPSEAKENRFAIITGPFRSEGRAQNYKVRENLPAQVRVLSVSRVLQNTEPARTTP